MTVAALQGEARNRARNSQGENQKIAAGKAIKGFFKGAKRTEHHENPSCSVNPAGCSCGLAQSGQCLDSTDLSIVQIIFTSFG